MSYAPGAYACWYTPLWASAWELFWFGNIYWSRRQRCLQGLELLWVPHHSDSFSGQVFPDGCFAPTTAKKVRQGPWFET